MAASFQEAVVDCLVSKAMQAVEHTGLIPCHVGRRSRQCELRQRLTEAAADKEIRLFIAPCRSARTTR